MLAFDGFGIPVNLVLTALGIAALCGGGNFLVTGGASVARRLGMSGMMVGMTVVAYGTSTPELAASIIAATENHGDIILGNVVGSNIANVGMVIGAAAILATLAIGRRTLRREIPIMAGFSALLVVLSLDGEVSQYDGVVLLAALALFGAYAFRRPGSAGDTDGSGSGAYSYRKSVIYIVGGVAFLYFGAALTVGGAVAVAEELGVQQRIIGITVIAVGTSLPELVTSVVAVRRGHADIGVGNIIGSNICNILMIMGVASAIAGVRVAPVVFADYAIMILFSLALFAALRSGVLGRPVGLALVAGYAVYLAATIVV